jgi:hypothetical protein
MKQWYCLLSLLSFHYVVSCPTCMGRLNTKTPTPFFSDEQYKPYTQAPTNIAMETPQENTDKPDDEEHHDTTEDLLP